MNEEQTAIGYLHGSIGLFAKELFGISDNLSTEETFAQMRKRVEWMREELAKVEYLQHENTAAWLKLEEAEQDKKRMDALGKKFAFQNIRKEETLGYFFASGSPTAEVYMTLREIADALIESQKP